MTATPRPRPARAELKTAIAEEYAEAARRRGREHAGAIERWIRWCADTGHNALPADEQAMLRWAHSHYPNWSFAYVRVQGTAIRNWHLDNGLPDPRTDRWKRYLDALARDLGTSKEEHKVDDMTAGELHAVNAVFRDQMLEADEDTIRARGAIAASVLLGIPLWVKRGTRASDRVSVGDILCRDTDVDDTGNVRLSHHGTSTLVQADRAPYLAMCLREALATCDPDEAPFTISKTLRGRICQRIVHHRPGTGHGTVGTALFWRDLPAEEVEWFLRTLGPKAAAGLTHSALLLTGTLQARRHQDIRELLLTHVQVGTDCIVYLQPRSKTDQTGDGIEKILVHLHPETSCTTDSPCHTECPVRALTDYLAFETCVAHRTTGPLFASRQSGRTTALTDSAWRHTLKKAWKAARLPGDARIATRSMRVTGATLAYQGGATIADVCSLTDHRSPEMAGVYVRRRNPHGHHITLDENAGDS